MGVFYVSMWFLRWLVQVLLFHSVGAGHARDIARFLILRIFIDLQFFAGMVRSYAVLHESRCFRGMQEGGLSSCYST